jgi:hypothetical protein
MYKTHCDALELRVKMYAQAGKWDHVEPIAETLARLIKDAPFGVYMWCHSLRMQKRYKEALVQLTLAQGKFLKDWRFSYDLACCLAMTGHKEEASPSITPVSIFFSAFSIASHHFLIKILLKPCERFSDFLRLAQFRHGVRD